MPAAGTSPVTTGLCYLQYVGGRATPPRRPQPARHHPGGYSRARPTTRPLTFGARNPCRQPAYVSSEEPEGSPPSNAAWSSVVAAIARAISSMIGGLSQVCALVTPNLPTPHESSVSRPPGLRSFCSRSSTRRHQKTARPSPSNCTRPVGSPRVHRLQAWAPVPGSRKVDAAQHLTPVVPGAMQRQGIERR